MSTEPLTSRASRTHSGRAPTRHELTQFYRAIGIPAVLSAAQASKMTPAPRTRASELPPVLRDAHAVS